MTLGDLLKKERERKGLSREEMATRLELSVEDYEELETGQSVIEDWGPKLAQIAIKLSVPTSRLISETGKAAQAKLEDGQCGKLIKTHREQKQLSAEELASHLAVPVADVVSIEKGESPLETYAPVLLRYAETIEQPIFNLFYPCGLPFRELQDYP